jgi:replicative DNA helicase
MEYPPETEVDVLVAPHSKQAEEAVLGSVLINSDNVREIDLSADDFYVQRNQWIWETVQEMARSGREIDYVTVMDELDARGKLTEIGGAAYITQLVGFVGSSLNGSEYAEIIRETASRRRLLSIANLLAKNAYDRSVPVDQTISDIAVRLPALCKVKSGARHISEYASRHYDRIDSVHRGEVQTRIIPTGFKDFDETTFGGLREKELMWLIGLPGLGKTKWALQAAFQIGQHGTGAAIYSWETGEEDIMDREISRQARIPQDRLERGDIKDDEWAQYTHIIENLSKSDLPIYLEFEGGMNATALRADLSRLKAEHNIQVFVIDYLKFFKDRLRGESETDRQNRLSGELKSICRELSLAGIVIDVYNKEGMKAAIPKLDDQAQGADKSYDADKVLFMVNHVPRHGEIKQDNVRTFIWGKSRRKLTRNYFHMVASAEFPEFGELAYGPYDNEPLSQPKPSRKREPAVSAADLEPDWNSNEDLEL